MLKLFTKETVLKAKSDPAALADLVETTRFILLATCLENMSEDLMGEDNEAVNCPRCGELTLYSQQVVLPGLGKTQMMCMSQKCIQDAVLALSHTYESEESSNSPAPPMNE